MRFNKEELAAFVSNPTTKFEREGLLIITERQEGFFRRTDVNYPRWCKLRGNLFFYFKDHDPHSHLVGVIVLENCRPLIRNEEREFDGFAFILEFDGSLPQRISTRTATERLDWVKCIQLASYSYLNRQINYLQNQVTTKMGNKIERRTPIYADANDTVATILYDEATEAAGIVRRTSRKLEEDLSEVPICESVLSCDNLICNNQSRLPNPRVTCFVLDADDHLLWRHYANTEVVYNTANPHFLCTLCFRKSDGFNSSTLLRFTVYDVREKVSLTAISLGYVEILLGVIQDATRFRIPLRSLNGECGFITIASWAPVTDDNHSPARSITQVFQQETKGHRRSQSLPPKLPVKLFVPFQSSLQCIYANPTMHTYRLLSSMGADISVHETLLESRLNFSIPQQLLSIWIAREKELLQEISGMGELGGEWRRRQMDLLDKHLKMLKDYSQAKQNLQQILQDKGPFFKRSSVKTDESLEFIPVNLHLQRMWAQNDSINRTGVLDVTTVGAFTRHASKGRTGGLIKLLQETKQSPSKLDGGNACKVQAANDAVQAIKQLRNEIVDIMSQLLYLAKNKEPKDMMHLCNDMVLKTKTLLNLWEPNLVDEAFTFIEQHRIIEQPDNGHLPMSPFRRITEQLSALDLKSPELEDFATPVVEPPDLWPRSSSLCVNQRPSTINVNAISPLHHTCLPVASNKDVHGQLGYSTYKLIDVNEVPYVPGNGNAILSDAPPYIPNTFCNNLVSLESACATVTLNCKRTTHNSGFLDTKIMSSSPSANYYRPTEEPEPLDLTQLNIEASVMCLVSKIKFLCGRCGSPATRLRQPKINMKRSGFSTTAPDVLVGQPTIEAVKTISTTTALDSTASTKNLSLNSTEQRELKGEDKLFVKRGNKFTDGLDLSVTPDWTSELRPSMRKLRHAMDGLLKTARLMHSVQRLQQDIQSNSMHLEIMYRRDICFSQALTALISALMAKIWGTEINDTFLKILSSLGPLAYFEGLLSLYGGETDMWSDMCIAIEDLSSVNFTLVRKNLQKDVNIMPTPRVIGARHSLEVLLPVPEDVYIIIPTKTLLTFKVTPVFFNIGINEKATLAETLGHTREQHRSNGDNFMRLKQYYSRFRKLNLNVPHTPSKHEPHLPAPQQLLDLLNFMEEQLHANVSKNVKILHIAEDICRLMSGLRFTSCKSAKDRTGMAVTLEQCRVLVQDFQLATKNVSNVLSTMRSEGARMDNAYKNISKRKYAFNLPQVLALPAMYRPPVGAYGKAET